MAKDSRTEDILGICDEALALDDADRTAFVAEACGDDTRFRKSVESILRAITAAGNFLVPQSDSGPAKELIGTRIGSYRLLSCLGEGGMGAVYLAERNDGQFVQRVAIKLVRSQFVVPELVERFDAERRILATLNHPYIAALIDGGTTDTGVPYLVMEYIDGAPVDAWCDAHRLDLRARVRLIQKIAMAVQAAHQNLIVHRDLKPSNVLITADGIPKLLDFGIAKLIPEEPVSESGYTTIFGHQALTPNYASPEHILENVVTTVSDVYSLGVLSYELLTGHLPYAIDTTSRRSLLHSVENLRRTTAGKRGNHLPGDLDNILMKALSREPERRYSSVAGFSADLDRYLKGLPVDARPDSAAYRLRRFIGRNKLVAATASALALTLVIALGVTSWAYFQAEAARAEATKHFDDVRALAKTMMFEVYDEVSKLGGATRAREILANSTQTYLDSLAGSEFASPDVQLEAGQGYARLGDVTGGIDDMTLGDRNSADENYRLAELYLEDLHQRYPENPEYALAAANLQSRMAAHDLYANNDVERARQHASRSVALYGAIKDSADEVILGHVGALKELADTYDWSGDHGLAADLLREALALLAGIDTSPASHPAAAAAKAGILTDFGDALYYLDEMESSLQQLRSARDLYREALPHAENIPGMQRRLAITLFSLAGAEVDAGQKRESLATIDEGLEISRTLYDADPEDAGSQQLYIAIAQQRGMILSELGQHVEAIEQAHEAYELQKALNARTTNDANASRELTIEMFNVGGVYLNAGRSAEACLWITDALSRLETLRADGALAGYDEQTLLPQVQAAHEEACQLTRASTSGES